MIRRALLTGTIAASLLAPTAPAALAQGDHRIPRSLLFAIGGAAAGAAVGTTYLFFNGSTQPGACGGKGCVMGTTMGVGAVVGFLIGREFDQLHALRYRGGAPLHPRDVSVGLAGEPTVLAVRDSLIAVGGGGGVQVFRSGVSLQSVGTRASGVRGIVALDIAPGTGQIALGSVSGLYLYPPVQGPGTLVREGDVSATAATGDRIFLGSGTRVEVAPARADSARGWPGIDLGSPVRDLEMDPSGNRVWAVTDKEIVALELAGDSLARVGAASLDAPARRLSIDGTRGVVAAGEGGVRIFDLSNPSAPQQTATWTTAHFAYDVSLTGKRLYVAAGPEGVYVLDVSGAQPKTLGLARDLGFAAALTSRSGFTYVLDRRTNSLRRIPSYF